MDSDVGIIIVGLIMLIFAFAFFHLARRARKEANRVRTILWGIVAIYMSCVGVYYLVTAIVSLLG